MTSKNITLTRKEYDLIAKSRGIKEPQKMSTEKLLDTLRCDSKLKAESNRRKLNKIHFKKIAKKQNISRNELRKAKKLKDKSIDELQVIAKLRGIKNYDNLTKEDLIFSLLKSESNPAERNYMECFNNNTNHEIKSKKKWYQTNTQQIRKYTENDRKKIKKELYEIQKRQNLSDNENKKIYDDLVKLANTFDKKEEHKHGNCDDLDYFGIRELEKLFDDVDIDDDNFYKAVLIKSYFKRNYEPYEIRGDKDKKLSINQYLYVVMPGLADLINKNMNDRVECKIQLNIGVGFIFANDTGEIRTFDVRSDNEGIRLGNEIPEIISKLVNSFLSKYQDEEKMLRRGSNFVFDSTDFLYVDIHKIDLKRGKSYMKSLNGY